VTARVGAGGRVCLFTSATAHLLADVNGHHSGGGGGGSAPSSGSGGSSGGGTSVRTASISGKVSDSAGVGIAGVTVGAIPYSALVAASVTGDLPVLMQASESVVTDASGNYTLESLVPGPYVVEYAPGSGTQLTPQFFRGGTFVNSNTLGVLWTYDGLTTAGVDEVLEGTATVTGVVTDLNGNPVDGATVELSMWSQVLAPGYGGLWVDRGATQSATTAVDGTYTFSDAYYGTEYQVFATKSALGETTELTNTRSGCFDAGNTVVVGVSGGSYTRSGAIGGGSISGRITGSWSHIFALKGAELTSSATACTVWWNTPGDASFYRVFGLPAGDYVIAACQGGCSLAVDEYLGGTTDRSSAQVITVGPGQWTHVDKDIDLSD